MINYWTTLLLLLLSWIFGLFIEGITEEAIFISVLFFGLYFLLPLLKNQWEKLAYLALPIFVAIMFISPTFNGFIWLMYLTLALQAMDVFENKQMIVYILFLYLLIAIPQLFYQEWLAFFYITLLTVLTGTMYFYLKLTQVQEQQVQVKFNELKEEFQSLKQQLFNNEQAVRQEERNQIAREIHDSVGHRLTALLMQLEVERIQAPDESTKNRFTELKQLAQSSLYDTREAVKTLQTEETVGIQAIIQLIRKLEAESQLRLSITMQTGVLGIYLSNKQSVTIYRSIQEALTNMMRHSSSYQAAIEFQIVAERDLRFQVGHPIKEKVHIQEGFGLANIRERLTEINGRLTIDQTADTLYLIGQFPLEETVND
jgi:signal transduction histidine kinase